MAKKKDIFELKTAKGAINRATTGDGRVPPDAHLKKMFGKKYLK